MVEPHHLGFVLGRASISTNFVPVVKTLFHGEAWPLPFL
jgi:hypothetical protein